MKAPKEVRKVGGKFYKFREWFSTKAEAQKAQRKLPSGRLFPFNKGYALYARHYPFGRARF